MNIFRGEVEVEIGGEKRLIKFGTNASAKFCEMHGKDLHEIQIHKGTIRDLIYAGLFAGAKKQKKEVTFDEYDVGDWLDEIPQEEANRIEQAMINSAPDVTESDDTKKK